jgi:hypothetical protein
MPLNADSGAWWVVREGQQSHAAKITATIAVMMMALMGSPPVEGQGVALRVVPVHSV